MLKIAVANIACKVTFKAMLIDAFYAIAVSQALLKIATIVAHFATY